jgi:hypothetical protein
MAIGGGAGVTTCSIYSEASGTWTATGTMANNGNSHVSYVLMGDGRVIGGARYNNATMEYWTPATGLWTTISNPIGSLYNVGAVALPNGNALFYGGSQYNGSSPTAVSHVFRWATNDWVSNVYNYPEALSYLHPKVLSDGRVLSAGGYNSTTGGVTRACILDVAVGAWANIESMAQLRYTYRHQWAVLSDRRVMVVAGYTTPAGGPIANCELYSGDVAQSKPWLPALLDRRHA